MSIENILLQLSESLAQVARRLVEQESKTEETKQELEAFKEEAEQKGDQIFEILNQKQDKFVEIDGVSVGVSAKLVSLSAAISTLRWEIIGKPAEGDEPATGIYADIEQNSISEERADELLNQINEIAATLEELSGESILDESTNTGDLSGEETTDSSADSMNSEVNVVEPEENSPEVAIPQILGDGILTEEESEKLTIALRGIKPGLFETYYVCMFGRKEGEKWATAYIHKMKADSTAHPKPPPNHFEDILIIGTQEHVVVTNTRENNFVVQPAGFSIFRTTLEGEFTIGHVEFIDFCLSNFSESVVGDLIHESGLDYELFDHTKATPEEDVIIVPEDEVQLQPLPDEDGTVSDPGVIGDGLLSREEMDKLYQKMQEVSPNMEPPEFYYGASFGFNLDGAAVAHVWKGYPEEKFDPTNPTEPPPVNFIMDLYCVCAFDKIIISNTTLNDFEVIPNNNYFIGNSESATELGREFSLNEFEFLALCLEKFSGTDWANVAKENFKVVYVSGPPLIDMGGDTSDNTVVLK